MAENLGRINVAYITSAREVGLDEKVGQAVVDGQRRIGNLEDLARRSQDPNDSFSQHFNLVTVITDDSDEQWEKSWAQGDIWNPLMEVCNYDGEGNTISRNLEAITHRVSSLPWRRLRGQAKQEAKAEYERRIIEILQANDVDLVICDSYISLFADQMLTAYGRFNGETTPSRIVNIHPAITEASSPFRLRGLTPTRDAWTRARYGWVVIDDKYAVDIPPGERGFEVYNGEQHEVVYIPEENRYTHGVTVHEVTKIVDNGPVIMSEMWRVRAESIEEIRQRNYEIKRRLLTQALVSYVNRPEVQDAILRDRDDRERAKQSIQVANTKVIS